MNELQMLHNLEIIRDTLQEIMSAPQMPRPTMLALAMEAHRTAHYACESAYASMEEEAHAMELAQGTTEYEPEDLTHS